MNLLTHLSTGADAARTLSEIAEAAGCSRREVEQSVQEARLRGVPVITGPRGAYLAVSPSEVREQAARLRSRAIHQIETAQALERAAERMADPLTLWSDAA